ncbi:hypothetical protein AC579_5116 [Pseudocercospora musae]|uniref:ARID domain-containing protein n=1 Tax=Pseudocercospora musae TaxID=113226 RepID=A0A139INT4_9PEZI|nr:hypothetical protein AC579_5116 [Pseudocercospora musae]
MDQYNQWAANPGAIMANYMNGPQAQTFNLQPTVPQKRQHDGSGMSASPPPQSRSQTPAYGNSSSNTNNTTNNTNFAAPTPYQHLQQPPGSNNATPSPTMQNQQFRPPSQQPRIAASPSPFPGQTFGNSMPGTPNAMQQGQMGQMGQYGQQYAAMNPSMSMAGMPSMQAMNGIGNIQANNATNAQRAYQAKLLAHQAQLRQQGVVPPRSMGGQPGHMMPGGQQQNAQMQQAQAKRAQFMKALQGHAAQSGRPFNPTPMVGSKPVDLYMLWTVVTSAGGAAQVDRNNQWPSVALKMGFPQQQFPSAAEELKNIHQSAISHYERMWFQMKMQQKQEAARMHAQQMAGFSNPQQQQSPAKMMPGQGQTNQYQQQLQQMQQQAQQGTPVQANASLPQNGMSTPQQMMNSTAAMHHRRNSSARKPEQMTPQQGAVQPSTASPLATKQQRTPSIKQETGAVMKSEEPQSTSYVPQVRSIEQDGGHDIQALFDLGSTISRAMPNMPTVDEMGVIDTKAITLSLASGIHGEVRYALDTLVTISHDQRVALNLEQCEDLIDVLVDCGEDQAELLSEDAVEVSDALDLPPYEDVMRGAKAEAETLQEVPEFGSREYDLDRAADKLIAITTVLRNFSFYEFNHRLLTSSPLIKWLSNTIRLLGTRNMFLRTYYNTQDFFKDIIIFLSNVTQSLELPARDDALHILHFLLAFAPQPAPSYSESGGKIRFVSFSPLLHRYLPPAIDCLAKLLARQDPNRTLYKSIFTSNGSSAVGAESSLDLLTRAFALSISVLPDRSKGSIGNTAQLRIVEARKAYLTQGMLAADILTTLAPGNDTELARSWIESEDGWAVGLLNLAALLSVDRNQAAAQKGRELGMDTETFKLITHRALAMMKRLAEKAGKGSAQKLFTNANGAVSATTNGITNGVDPRDDDDFAELRSHPKWEGIPQGHAILGALMMPNTDKVALGLLCGLHEMAMQHN